MQGKGYREIERQRVSNKLRLSVPYLDKCRALLRMAYVRYADDWVLFSNASLHVMKEIMGEISDFLLNELGLTLSIEKTKLTNVGLHPVKFLGFSLGYYSSYRKTVRFRRSTFVSAPLRSKVGDEFSSQAFSRVTSSLRRTTGNQIRVGIDQERLDSRLRLKGFISDKLGPRKEIRAHSTGKRLGLY